MNRNSIFFLLFILFALLLFQSRRFDSVDKATIIPTLVRGCARWAVASLQDRSPLIAVLHANYAAGYLWALRDIFSDTDIQRFGDVKDIIAFQKRIVEVQDTATRRVIERCPEYASDIDNYLGRLSREKQ